jgi:hypothetical protein
MILDAPTEPEERPRFVMPRAPLVDPRRAPVMVPRCAAAIVFILGALLVEQVLGHSDAVAEVLLLWVIGPYAVITLATVNSRSRPFGYAIALLAGVPVTLVLLLFVLGLPLMMLAPFGLAVADRTLQEFLYLLAYMFATPAHVMLVLYAWAGIKDEPPIPAEGVFALLGMIAYAIFFLVWFEQVN